MRSKGSLWSGWQQGHRYRFMGAGHRQFRVAVLQQSSPQALMRIDTETSGRPIPVLMAISQMDAALKKWAASPALQAGPPLVRQPLGNPCCPKEHMGVQKEIHSPSSNSRPRSPWNPYDRSLQAPKSCRPENRFGASLQNIRRFDGNRHLDHRFATRPRRAMDEGLTIGGSLDETRKVRLGFVHIDGTHQSTRIGLSSYRFVCRQQRDPFNLGLSNQDAVERVLVEWRQQGHRYRMGARHRQFRVAVSSNPRRSR